MMPEQCLARLIERLKDADEFPHEIGLFLGYPPEDVEGFIQEPNGQKYTGIWKVSIAGSFSAGYLWRSLL